MLIEADNVTKSYGGDAVLKDVSLGVDPGESVAITGPSGSGKSTLVSMLGLLLQPTGGEVRFDGQSASRLTDDRRSRLRNRSFGFIFQNPQLIGSLSALDNVLVPARLARRRGLEEVAGRMLASLGLEHRLSHLPHQLSIGQKRRVAVARALVLSPIIVFADEPTNDLDRESAETVASFLFALPGKGHSLVMVTHDTGLSGKAGRVLNIVDGRLIES